MCLHSFATTPRPFSQLNPQKNLMFSLILGRTLCCPSGELVTHLSCSDTLPYFWKKKQRVNAFLMIWGYIWCPMVFNFVFNPASCSFELLSQLQSKGCNNRKYKDPFWLPPNQWKLGLRSRPWSKLLPNLKSAQYCMHLLNGQCETSTKLQVGC